ncbi:hypothetical protein SARC_00948 [Sphaeroforma arctica JP610]|uniref:LIM zinc-binding domain-containing protein n=1 Tax=Sphaeroforma arctica JP610 TaxID=667725 RepID=A0A0L0GF16_9EUKA|nr:hypothetical protein SARC_00948 [Sphaeroforma arctica JP610]KNC86903.1 hypothetical protein SARC_00948 [Sphaeroforma arctica JP610]|eukprot:XP_014160805.1 hypothetical protein SARC_00948 [Sphaeroforma arctica JP610]
MMAQQTLPRCNGCSEALEAVQYLEAGDAKYHKQCFKCKTCASEIGAGAYALVFGNPTCQTCVQVLSKQPSKTIPNTNAAVGWTRRTTGVRVTVQSEKCSKCMKSVYPAEKLSVGGKPWHKQCFKCNGCAKALSLGAECMREDTPYCKGCYGKDFGPEGFGRNSEFTYTAAKYAADGVV